MNRNILRTSIVIGVFFVAAMFLLAFMQGHETQTAAVGTGQMLTLSESRWDFGEIPMDEGMVTKEVTLTNTGSAPVTITKMETSCMCTTAQIVHEDGQKSALRGMVGHGGTAALREVIQPNKSVVIRTNFDPNAHGPDATGPITRDVTLQTNAQDQAQIKLAFSGNVVKTRSMSLIELRETEHDFGVVKQSGGLQSYPFHLKYNGKVPLKVTALPASCGCTSATINKPLLQPGDEATITVVFDPNLHAEPEGKFYKTVSLITDPPLDQSVELKIWAIIDLDLGAQAYKQPESDEDHDEEALVKEGNFHTVLPALLASWMQHKDFTLVDVHVPQQTHIEGTDAVIPYNQIAENLSELPSDKNAKIVLYCRSGSMSKEAADLLTRMGYTNVYHLEGGIQAYQEYLNQQ